MNEKNNKLIKNRLKIERENESEFSSLLSTGLSCLAKKENMEKKGKRRKKENRIKKEMREKGKRRKGNTEK